MPCLSRGGCANTRTLAHLFEVVGLPSRVRIFYSIQVSLWRSYFENKISLSESFTVSSPASTAFALNN